jgi:hypothetical protein
MRCEGCGKKIHSHRWVFITVQSVYKMEPKRDAVSRIEPIPRGSGYAHERCIDIAREKLLSKNTDNSPELSPAK